METAFPRWSALRRRGGLRTAAGCDRAQERGPADADVGGRPAIQPGRRGLAAGRHRPGAPGPRQRHPGARRGLGRPGDGKTIWPPTWPTPDPPGARWCWSPATCATPRSRSCSARAAPRDHPDPAPDGRGHPRHPVGPQLGRRHRPVECSRRHPDGDQGRYDQDAVAAGGDQCPAPRPGSDSSAWSWSGPAAPCRCASAATATSGSKPSRRSRGRSSPDRCRSPRGPRPGRHPRRG